MTLRTHLIRLGQDAIADALESADARVRAQAREDLLVALRVLDAFARLHGLTTSRGIIAQTWALLNLEHEQRAKADPLAGTVYQ